MNLTEKQQIHILFETKNYIELYKTQSDVLNEMLMINNKEEFKDFLSCENFIDERIFLLYDSAIHGESLLIGGYEGDATSQVNSFLKSKLSENIFSKIEGNIENLYVDIDDKDNIKEKIDCCNQKMKDTCYLINVEYEDTYCAGAYFLSVVQI